MNIVTKRLISLEEIERVNTFALDVNLEASMPLELMESYLNFAELSCLQGKDHQCFLVSMVLVDWIVLGMMSEALPFWWETKDLFCYLFADGTLVPIARRCSFSFLVRLEKILSRIVRFMWKLDHQTRIRHLFLIDMYVTLSMESSRVSRSLQTESRKCSTGLFSTIRMVLKDKTEESTAAVEKSHASTLSRPRDRKESILGRKKREVPGKRPASWVQKIFRCGGFGCSDEVNQVPSIDAFVPITFTSALRQSLQPFIADAGTHDFAESLKAARCVTKKIFDFGWSKTQRKTFFPALSSLILTREDFVSSGSPSLRPLDPFDDFTWMDYSYAPSHSPSPSDIPRNFSGKLFLSSRSHAANDNEVCEKIVIQRVWSLWLRMEGISNHSSDLKLLPMAVNKLMRGTLCKAYHLMVRLRAFSRQFKASAVNLAGLKDILEPHSSFSPTADSQQLNVSPQLSEPSNDPLDWQLRFSKMEFVAKVRIAFVLHAFPLCLCSIIVFVGLGLDLMLQSNLWRCHGMQSERVFFSPCCLPSKHNSFQSAAFCV